MIRCRTCLKQQTPSLVIRFSHCTLNVKHVTLAYNSTSAAVNNVINNDKDMVTLSVKVTLSCYGQVKDHRREPRAATKRLPTELEPLHCTNLLGAKEQFYTSAAYTKLCIVKSQLLKWCLLDLFFIYFFGGGAKHKFGPMWHCTSTKDQLISVIIRSLLGTNVSCAISLLAATQYKHLMSVNKSKRLNHTHLSVFIKQ